MDQHLLGCRQSLATFAIKHGVMNVQALCVNIQHSRFYAKRLFQKSLIFVDDVSFDGIKRVTGCTVCIVVADICEERVGTPAKC